MVVEEHETEQPEPVEELQGQEVADKVCLPLNWLWFVESHELVEKNLQLEWVLGKVAYHNLTLSELKAWEGLQTQKAV